MTSPLEQKAVEIINQLQHLAPRATDIALQTARINALADLMAGVIWSVIFLAFALFSWRVYWPWLDREDQDSIDGPMSNFIVGLCLGLVLVGTGLASISYLGDLWTWVGIFHPELALAHKLI